VCQPWRNCTISNAHLLISSGTQPIHTRFNIAHFFGSWHSFRHVTLRFVCSLDTLQIAINYVRIRCSFLWYATTRHIPDERKPYPLVPPPPKAKSLRAYALSVSSSACSKSSCAKRNLCINISVRQSAWNGTTLLPSDGCWRGFALGMLIKICR
jgi:hypothetical protein